MSVLKLLFNKYPDVDVNVLEEHLQRASQGPFYQAEFDSDAGQGTVYRSESTTSGMYRDKCATFRLLFHRTVNEQPVWYMTRLVKFY